MSNGVESSPSPAIVWAERDPDEGARRLALGFLDQAASAKARIADPDDVEGLHDFRVALRRLRSTLGTFDDLLGRSVGRKLAKRLKKLAGATGEGRDAEVALAWLEATAAGAPIPPSARPGYLWLRSRLESVRDRAYGEIVEEIDAEFEPLAERLRERLSVYRAEVRLDAESPPRRLGEVASAALLALSERLGSDLAAVASPEDEEGSHRARIVAKRLRYLLEPFVAECPTARAATKRLKQLQDLLGELHDAHVMERLLRETAAEAGAERARRTLDLALSGATAAELSAARRRPLESGLVELGRRNRARRDDLFARLAEAWLSPDGSAVRSGRGLAALTREVTSTAAALAPASD